MNASGESSASARRVAAITLGSCLALGVAGLVASHSRRSLRYRQALPVLPGDVRVLVLAHSTDGQDWTVDPDPLVRGADVPDLVQTSDGTLLYFMDSIGDRLAVMDLATRTRSDLDLGPACDANEGRICVDPAGLQTGERGVRLFFVSAAADGDPATPGAETLIYSADSTDGRTFHVSSQPLLRGPGLVDPDPVRLPLGAVRLYVSQLTPRGPMVRSAYSTNGRDFEWEPGVRMPHASASSTMVGADGTWNHWYHDLDSQILRSTSTDGLNIRRSGPPVLTQDICPGTRLIGAEAPSVIATADGWLMALGSTVEPSWPFNEFLARRAEADYDRAREESGKAH